jgi:cell division protein FtsZ
MIHYTRETKATVPASAVKIIGLGGAGTNMLERIALDGTETAELLVLNTDLRTLTASIARDKIQLGANLTKGLGAGGDPELGQSAVIESEEAVRSALRGRRIVFLCTGLGGGTGSGAAPIVTRIAREEGAFVVVFATMPFTFEGRRRRDQAERALNELAVLANALVTFDNNRMGELVLAKQGVHEAFTAADRMICESIKAVIRLVVRPGLINIGLDDLVTALRTTRSRCLFGSGVADGKDRAAKALRNALSSPLLDQGALLRDAQSVLVHLSGGESLTLYEIELLMQQLQKYVPEKAHILFGAAIDPAMGDELSITLISALPEDVLASAPLDGLSAAKDETAAISLEPTQGFTPEPTPEPPPAPKAAPEPEPEPEPAPEPKPEPASEPEPELVAPPAPPPVPEPTKVPEPKPEPVPAPAPTSDERPFAEPAPLRPVARELPFHQPKPDPPVPKYVKPPEPDLAGAPPRKTVLPPRRETVKDIPELTEIEAPPAASLPKAIAVPDDAPANPAPDSDLTPAPRLALNVKPDKSQTDLPFDSVPRGRFQGETPNVVDGEDLDLPPFLRKKKS